MIREEGFTNWLRHMKSKQDDVVGILAEDIDDEILERMPEWFRILKKASEENFDSNQ